MEEDNREIGKRIRKRRLERSLTQAQLADLTGYQSKTSINKIEMGKQGIRTAKIKVFADALDTTPDYLMGWTDDPYDWDADPMNLWPHYHENMPFWEICLEKADGDEEYARQLYDEGIEDFYNDDTNEYKLIYGEKSKALNNNIMGERARKYGTTAAGDPYANKPNRIKVYGSVPAGIPLEANEDIIGWEDIPEEWLYGDRQFFGLRVQGDSMEPEYRAGDIIVVLKQPDCESGQDAVVYVNGYEATLKRVFKQQFGILLQPLNPKYEPRFYDYGDEYNPVVIVGIVREIRRRVNW